MRLVGIVRLNRTTADEGELIQNRSLDITDTLGRKKINVIFIENMNGNVYADYFVTYLHDCKTCCTVKLEIIET